MSKTQRMVLRGGLSNPHFQDLIKSLANKKAKQRARKHQKPRAGWSDGRRKFGTVSRAIKQVMAGQGELKLKEIHALVELALGDAVSLTPWRTTWRPTRRARIPSSHDHGMGTTVWWRAASCRRLSCGGT
jgi:hypothetical protein